MERYKNTENLPKLSGTPTPKHTRKVRKALLSPRAIQRQLFERDSEVSELTSDCSDGHQSADNEIVTQLRGNADGEFVGFPSTSDSDDDSEGDDSDVSELFRDTRLDTPAVGIRTTLRLG